MKHVVLHIGTGKTGTSTLQNALYRARRRLRRQHGVDYARLGLTRIDHYGEKIAAHYQLVERLRHGEAAALAEIGDYVAAQRAHTVLFSCENLYHHLDETHIALLHRLLEGHRVTVICYVRRQDDYVESAYRHRVKVGAAGGPMGSFVSRHVNAADLGVVHANYHRVLAPWRRCFGAQAMVVRPFDEARFAGGDLLTDFLCAAGLDGIRLPRRPAARANRAVPAELVRVLRVVNEAGSIPADEHPSFVRYLRARHEFADYPLLDATTRARILANYADSNRQLFAQYGLDGDWSAPASAAAPGNAAMARDDDAVRLANLYCDAWRHRNARWGRRSALRLRALARRARYVYGDGVFYLVALCRAQLPTAALSRRAYLRLLGRMMLQRDFSPSYYSQTHLDIRAAGLDPLLHYLQYGWREARIPHPARSERDARGIADRIAAGEHPYLCDWVRRVTPT